MKKQWMRWAALAMAAALLMTAAGCGQQSSDQPGAAGEPKGAEPEESAAFVPAMDREAQAEIRVRGSWSNFEALEAAVNDWNEIYSNVLVDYAKVDGYTHSWPRWSGRGTGRSSSSLTRRGITRTGRPW